MDGNNELRQKINEAKRRLPLPDLMAQLGFCEQAKKTAHCPFHDDEHKSFSVFLGDDGFWHWNCFAGCGDGDEIMFLSKLKGVSPTEAISLYLNRAGFPTRGPRKSHEYPKSRQSHKYPESRECHEPPKSPVFLVYPMSNGPELRKALKALAARNACNERITVKKGLWQLARDVRGLQKQIGQKLTNTELMLAFDEWYRLSEQVLDPAKRDDYLAAFLAKLAKVRRPTGEKGDALNEALAVVSKLSADELPVIPGIPNAPDKLRRVAALHRELSRRSIRKDKAHFLTCRDTAKLFPGLSHQTAWNINGALAELGVIKVVRPGDARPGGKASHFRYLLSEREQGDTEIAA
jgi:hypothetical protein